MDRVNRIFIVIGIIALSFVIYAANAQKIINPNPQPPATQNAGSSSEDEKSTEQAEPDQTGTSQSETSQEGVAQTEPQTKYVDGTYEGLGTGKNPGIKVRVTIKNDNITDITIISYNDNEEYFSEAAAVIPGSIIEAQSTNVDTVCGATLSSNGIIKAVADALSKAVKK